MGIAYREETPVDWAETVAHTWRITEAPDGVVLSGPCPTCGHQCDVDVKSAQGDVAGRKSGGERSSEPLVLLCRCDGEHPGQPIGERGCGRGGHLALTLTSDD